jgi:serine/threonine-protein kinase RsbW
MSATEVIRVRNDFEELGRLNEFLAAFWRSNHLPEDALLDLNLALEETFANVVMHAFEDRAGHEIQVEVGFENQTVRLTVEDEGVPFNPLNAPEVDVTAPLAERAVGGLGIYLVRKLMDRLEYTRDGDRNRLVMEKRLFGGTDAQR